MGTLSPTTLRGKGNHERGTFSGSRDNSSRPDRGGVWPPFALTCYVWQILVQHSITCINRSQWLTEGGESGGGGLEGQKKPVRGPYVTKNLVRGTRGRLFGCVQLDPSWGPCLLLPLGSGPGYAIDRYSQILTQTLLTSMRRTSVQSKS